MSPEFEVFCLNKYVREKNIDVSTITDPAKLDAVFNDIKSSSAFVEFCKGIDQQDDKFIESQNYNRYSFWLEEEPKETVYTLDVSVELEKARKYLKNCSSVIISCGAGLSVSSDLPCFHGKDGIWNTMFKIDSMYDVYKKTNPGKIYSDIKVLMEKLNVPYFVFTSNIDGLFLKSNFDPSMLCECHGSYAYKRCERCNYIGLTDDKRCKNCDILLRENILKYGDNKTFNTGILDVQEDNFKKFRDNNTNICIIELGCGIITPTVRHYDELLLETRSDVKLIRVNPDHWVVPSNIESSCCMINMTAEDFINSLEY